jgi:type I restriction enzyme M protein
MNLMLHGVENPDIHYQDTLSKNFPEKFRQQAEAGFDVILAKPPFKGSLDEEDVHPSLLKKVKTKKTELLFVALILRMLKNGGRSATIVPDGVLFGSSKAHVALRQHLIDDNQLEAVISLPSGVFKPYAGVSTAILIFTKGGQTGDVMFYDVQAVGRSLDDKQQEISEDDLPDVLEKFKQRRLASADFSNRTTQAFIVPLSEIRGNKYDLSINRYKEATQIDVQFDPPIQILARMKVLEAEIHSDMAELERML